MTYIFDCGDRKILSSFDLIQNIEEVIELNNLSVNFEDGDLLIIHIDSYHLHIETINKFLRTIKQNIVLDIVLFLELKCFSDNFEDILLLASEEKRLALMHFLQKFSSKNINIFNSFSEKEFVQNIKAVQRSNIIGKSINFSSLHKISI